MSIPAATVTVVLEDSNGMRTQRVYEAKSAAVTDVQAAALADSLQATTQLEVVDVLVTRRAAGWTPITKEANSSVAETASVRCQLSSGGFYTFNMPALKAALKSGTNVDGTNATLMSFLEQFDDGAGIAAVPGNFYVSDGEEISETYHEANLVTGKINR